MNKKELLSKEFAEYIIENKATIRQASKYFKIPKSTVHVYIHKYYPNIIDNEYIYLCQLLELNKSKFFK